MPIIQIQMLKGRDMAQKRAMIRDMTEAFTRNCGGDAHEVNIVISEIEPANWAAGGIPCSDSTNGVPVHGGGLIKRAEGF